MAGAKKQANAKPVKQTNSKKPTPKQTKKGGKNKAPAPRQEPKKWEGTIARSEYIFFICFLFIIFLRPIIKNIKFDFDFEFDFCQ